MNSKKNKQVKSKTKKNVKSGLSIRKSILDRKGIILPVILIALGLSLIPTGILTSFDTPSYSNENTVKNQFSSILLTIKTDLEDDFSLLLDNMANDPLNGLYMDKMPNPEEIFFAEWANDWFPEVEIPLIGDQIESIGAKMVGDINLDEESPNGDLNISSHYNPSGITQFQCQALWNSLNEFSIVSSLSDIWFEAIEGSIEDQEILKSSFNLSSFQLIFICTWINISQNSWMKLWIEEKITATNLLLLVGILAPGLALITFGSYKLISQKLKKSNLVQDKLPSNIKPNKKEGKK